MTSLSVRNVSKRYADFVALDDVNIVAASGEFLVLLGPSGCGKSTLLSMIAGLDRVTEGEIIIGDEVVNDLDPKERDIAMVFQSYALYPSMTVSENIQFGMRMRGVGGAERTKAVAHVAQMLHLEALLDRRPSQLSGGQRQRVAMGRALVRNPKVFLFDEPLSNLDAKLRVEMRTEIKRLHARLGATIVYVTHDQIEAMTLATKVVVMRQARVQQVGSPQEIYDRPCNMYVAGFIGSPPMNLIPGKLRWSDDRFFVEVERSTGAPILIPLAESPPQFGAYRDKSIVLGARPEAITEAGTTHDNSRPFRFQATVEVIEPTGSDNLAVLTLGGVEAIARLRPGTGSPGQELALAIDTQKLSVFDPQSEIRIDADA